jgi:molybdate transport system substrate-binding protein
MARFSFAGVPNLRIMSGQVDAGVTWRSEVIFQQSIRNPIQGVVIPPNQNITDVYAGGLLTDAHHPDAGTQWLAFLGSPEAQSIYRQYGFRSIPEPST